MPLSTTANNSNPTFLEIIKILCSVLLPPIGVFMQVGFGLHFWINIVLTLMGYIPGVIHAVWIIATRNNVRV